MKSICSCFNTNTNPNRKSSSSATSLTNDEKIAVNSLHNSDPFYIDKLTIRELKYLMSMIDEQERQWSGTYRKYDVALKRLENATSK